MFRREVDTVQEKKRITLTGNFLTADQILWGYSMWEKGYYKWEVGEALDVSAYVLHTAFRRNNLKNPGHDRFRKRQEKSVGVDALRTL